MSVMTAKEAMSSFPTFKVASMKTSSDKEVRVQNVRCKSVDSLFKFLRKLFEVDNLIDLYFLEIHEICKDGKVKVIWSSDQPWPQNIACNNSACVIAPNFRDDQEDEKYLLPVRDKEAELAVLEDYFRPLIHYKVEVA